MQYLFTSLDAFFSRKRIIHFTIFVIATSAIILLVTFQIIAIESRPYIYADIAALPLTQVALIPGAAILSNGNLSPVLKDRVDAAVRLYKAGKIEKILVSGDNSTLTYNEVNPVRNYLLTSGIPAEDIFLDHAGFDTYSSMYRARDIFQVSSITIVTQSFHLPRAIYVAHHLGIVAYGFNADSGRYLFKNYVREWFADVKASIDIAHHRKPKYTGNIIPITGDGRNNP